MTELVYRIKTIKGNKWYPDDICGNVQNSNEEDMHNTVINELFEMIGWLRPKKKRRMKNKDIFYFLTINIIN